MTFALAVLVASLLGSVHCAAMCGAFTCLYAPAGSAWRESRNAHAAYNVGRLAAYLLLGSVAGLLGAGLERAGTLAGVQHVAAIATAVLLVVWGAHALLVASGASVMPVRPPAAWQRAMGSVLHRLMDRPPVVRAAGTGLFTTLLPCGWLYAFVVTAAGTGTPWQGATLMAVFWVGTLPMMLAVGVGLQQLAGTWRARLPLASAATILLLGLLSLASHLDLVPAAHWLHRVMPSVPVVAAAPTAPSMPAVHRH
ncbi:MAG: sulfite exporter TauE/SafE family protein [Gemmatimonadales bacterium]|nr:sulfite exporter TauE/SafE family protein [Gemmatimonadales bacterium]MBP6569901.1 sulfite exporter TauE/SafE family protein [Gemmatimonadales bacterium]MBP7619985.1 sulfite exporter TauE/SafE family protein [Gemmatimonadales bacterium]MBP9899408.1 sulfite exporter TauE/SafE family protein [Gemmatimonadales bacterium]